MNNNYKLINLTGGSITYGEHVGLEVYKPIAIPPSGVVATLEQQPHVNESLTP